MFGRIPAIGHPGLQPLLPVGGLANSVKAEEAPEDSLQQHRQLPPSPSCRLISFLGTWDLKVHHVLSKPSVGEAVSQVRCVCVGGVTGSIRSLQLRALAICGMEISGTTNRVSGENQQETRLLRPLLYGTTWSRDMHPLIC